MRIVVVGAGGVGGYFGGRLAAAGEDVAFVARGSHLAALRSEGLRIESPLGAVHLPAVRATDAPSELGPCDLVLLCVKLRDSADAIASIEAPKPDTVVMKMKHIDGAILANLLLGLGVALVAGGLRHGDLRFDSGRLRISFSELPLR